MCFFDAMQGRERRGMEGGQGGMQVCASYLPSSQRWMVWSWLQVMLYTAGVSSSCNVPKAHLSKSNKFLTLPEDTW